MIAEVNHGQFLTLIVDHHLAEDAGDPSVLNLSTELYGISGEKEISAATTAWLFALVLDEGNRDLAYLEVIGVIGDSHEREEKLVGENREALEEAVARGEVQVEEAGGRETYTLTKFGREILLKPFAKSLTTLGAAGYAMGKPNLRVKEILFDPSPEYERPLSEFDGLRQEWFETMLAMACTATFLMRVVKEP